MEQDTLFEKAMRRAARRSWWPARLVVNGFHALWYHAPNTWRSNTFLGMRIYQNPLDLQLYQELIYEKRPQAIIQTGVLHGGSILYFACLMDLVGAPVDAPVIGIDVTIRPEVGRQLTHPRVRLLQASSIDDKTIDAVREHLAGRSALVVLDADHSAAHVQEELRRYAEFVPIGGSMVTEDTNLNGHPVARAFGPGPLEAVRAFLRDDTRFAPDDRWRRNLYSHHQHGWLKRLR
jgi:cephalosporin hydroxylase